MIDKEVNSIRKTFHISISKSLDKAILIATTILLFNCVFDPAGLFLKLKTISFIIVLLLVISKLLLQTKLSIPKTSIVYIFLIAILIPLLSIITVFLSPSPIKVSPKNLYHALNTGLFLLIVFVFYNSPYNYLKVFIFFLTCLAITIIILHLLVVNNLISSSQLQKFGTTYKIFQLATGPLFDKTIIRIYFWTSPILVLSIGYFSNKVITEPKKISHYILLLINILGMFYSGSRVNIFVSMITFISILLFYLRGNMLFFTLILSFTIIISFVYLKFDSIISMFGNNSDEVKLDLINDYFGIYTSDLYSFFFGQGIGSDTNFSGRNLNLTYSELTYFEIFRKYGLVLGGILLFLMFFPLVQIIRVPSKDKWIIITYGTFLIMAFFNPFYFSSNGMLILSFSLFYLFKENEINLKLNLYPKETNDATAE